MSPTSKSIERQLKRVRSKTLQQVALRPLLFTVALIGFGIGALVLLPGVALSFLGLHSPSIPPLNTDCAKIYDRQDHLVATVYGDRDEQPIALKDMGSNVTNAIIAAEDHDFYQHDGINPFSIGRAVLADMSAHHAVQGGSTISQQLVKNLAFEGAPRTFDVKVKEALMSMDMEHQYSKERILEAYLNNVYFGNGVYGIKRASEFYFAKEPAKLSIGEAAYLASLVNAPSELSSPAHRAAAINRQHMVLDSMADLKFITAAEAQRAKEKGLTFHASSKRYRNYRYYTNEALQIVRRELALQDTKEIFRRGLQIYTNLDQSAQAQAERAIADGIRRAPHGINQGALVSISVADGAIIAMVGGAGNYDHNQWNRALSPHTAGSAFKPFVYLAALSKGVLNPDSTVDDEPLEIYQPGAPVYRPRNFDGQFLGTITIRKALALSRNTCAVRVAQAVGPNQVAHFAHQAGITSHLDENLSLALGSSAVSPLEMANAYATLARGGEYIDPQMVRRIDDAQGHVIKEFQQRREQVFDREPVAELVDAMQDVVERGTGTRARLFDRPVAGKTGTSDQAKDLWFIGFTPDQATAVWGGNDDNRPVPGHATGGTTMAGIWQDYMRKYYQQHVVPAGEFALPEHPLSEEAEPLHLLPAPADIFQRLFGQSDNRGPEVREYKWDASRPGATEPPHQYEEPLPDNPPKRKGKGIIRKLLNWLDF